MSTQTRRSSVSSSSTSAAKRPAMSENAGKVVPPVPPHQAKKRVVLGNLQNLNNVPRQTRNQASTKAMVSAVTTAKLMAPAGPTVKLTAPAATTVKGKKAPSLYTRSAGLPKSSLPASSAVKTSALASTKPVSGSERLALRVESLLRPCSMDISPSRSDAGSVSMDETMSTCDSLKSSDIEYLDADASAIASIERKANNSFYISEHKQAAASESICKRDLLVEMDTSDEIVNLDNNRDDPQLCATIACDIYKHLRASEHKKRPSTDFMEGVQKDINASMRAILVDWLVEVAEEYRLVPDTLYLTVNYIDRYLSGNVMNRQRLQLLGVACMMIASKYEEICAPQVEEFCYITDNTYFKEEVLQMESAVLNFLKFEMTAPTVKCFLRRFVSAAHGNDEGSSLFLECLANYVGELSLLEYSMLCYPPSLIASSAIFLAKFIMEPAKKPWNSTLRHYTLYKPSELCKCVKELHRLVCNSASSSLPAIREKYSTHKYKFVAKKTCPPSIPSEYFVDLSS